ncbi:hypothetical protein P175DRAFT_0476455 [Aspergillus ochraceoroseus IBT 24754]|uniref:J domain-containing protein n=1 Tax=Aspergillus ochraceoroseus IBT 24754 TaxID=1392256 RepID=A0A2T5LYP1_9EURO|nr:uncharacterized protein P175DRAFT_0476455 [Aspergillus ochraceoroseus IBT 24754]PTU21400.1 hypothetical protein P175DRAFT_0476455 [Aspergillus ochraceoroseus IBT 24754]
MLKKPHIICYNGLQLLGQSYSRSWPASIARPYATAPGGFLEKELSWPSSPSFTPYDVFGQDRRAPYSKHRFYELVKIYHPDRPCNDHPLCRDISPERRLQRYHIVVAAHEILSNPSRRAAYDRCGTGWHLHPAGNHQPTPSWAGTGSSNYGPIFHNATWEDWERWYNRDAPRQETIVDHRTFSAFVVLLVLFGGAVQASWIGKLSTGYEDRLRDLNEQSTRFLNERRKNTVNQLGSSEAKVQHFLIRRDPSGYGLKEEEGPVYREVLNVRNNSSSEDAEEEETKENREYKHTS